MSVVSGQLTVVRSDKNEEETFAQPDNLCNPRKEDGLF